MARLGRGQPFAPQVVRAVTPVNQNIHGSTATVTVQAFMGSVYVEPPVPEKFNFRVGQAVPGSANPGEPGSLASPNGNVQGGIAQVTVAAPMGVVGVTYPGQVSTVSVAAYDKPANGTVTEAPAAVTVAAPMGVVGVTYPGQAATVAVAAFDQAPSVSTPGSTANVSVAALYGRAFEGINVLGSVATVSVQALYGAVSVSTPGPTVDLAAGFESGISGWGKYDNSSHGTNVTLAQSSAQSHTGASSALMGITGTVSAPIATYALAAPTNVPMTISAWVYSPQGYNGAFTGMDWYTGSAGSYISSSAGTTVNVPANTWTFVTCTAVAPATATWVHAKIGLTGAPSTSIQLYIDDVLITSPAYDLTTGYMGAASVSTPGSVANVNVAAPSGGAGGGAQGSVAAVTVAAYDAVPEGTVTELPGSVSVSAPMGTVSVSTPGSTAQVSVAAIYGQWGIGPPTPATPNIAVAAPYGSVSVSTPSSTGHVSVAAPSCDPGSVVNGATAGIVCAAPMGQVIVSTTSGPASVAVAAFGGKVGAGAGSGPAQVTVAALYGSVSVSTTQFGPSIVANPAGANGTTGWAGIHAATFIASSSPPAGCPESTAFEFVDDGISGGGHAIESSPNSLYPAAAGNAYHISAWVYSSSGNVQIGFDWRSSAQGYMSSSDIQFFVPANTWTYVTTTQTAPANAWYLVARVGTGTLGSTLWATDIFMSGAPNVTLAAFSQPPSVSLPMAPANCSIAGHDAPPSVSTPGSTGRVSVAAPTSPLVAALYVVNSQVQCAFTGNGTTQRRVWFGYTDIRNMNVQT